MFGKLHTDEIEELLTQQIVGRIGCHSDDLTYVVPISYAYDGTYVYGHSFEGMKVNMMRNNPKLCFQVDDTRDLSNWKSVICWGHFEELHQEKDRQEALEHLHLRKLPIISSETMHISSTWPFPGDTKNLTGIFFRVKLMEKTGRFEKSSDKDFYST